MAKPRLQFVNKHERQHKFNKGPKRNDWRSNKPSNWTKLAKDHLVKHRSLVAQFTPKYTFVFTSRKRFPKTRKWHDAFLRTTRLFKGQHVIVRARKLYSESKIALGFVKHIWKGLAQKQLPQAIRPFDVGVNQAASSLLVDRLESYVRFTNPLRTQAVIRKRLAAGYISVDGAVGPLAANTAVRPNQLIAQYRTDGKRLARRKAAGQLNVSPAYISRAAISVQWVTRQQSARDFALSLYKRPVRFWALDPSYKLLVSPYRMLKLARNAKF